MAVLHHPAEASLATVVQMQVQLLGPLAIRHDARAQPIPASRKTRAILGYLVLAGRPVSRQRLCSLFFDVPDDPRAALRWSLTKLRPLVDTPGTARLISTRDSVAFVPAGAQVDACALLAAGAPDAAAATALLGAHSGLLLEDAELPDRPDYMAWLVAERAAVRRAERRLLEILLASLSADPAAQLPWWQRCIDSDPFDDAGYAGLARALTALGRRAEAEQIVAGAERALRAEGMAPGAQLRQALRSPDRPAAAALHLAAAPAAAPHDPHSAPGVAAMPAPAGGQSLRTGTVPVVAVLPFIDMSPQPMAPYLIEGLADGVTHALSRFKSLTTLARMSTARYARALVDPRDVGQALGADLLVGAMLTQQGDQLRVRWRAIETQQARVVGSGDCVGSLADSWQLQEDAAAQIVTRIEPAALEEALKRAVHRPTQSAAAWDLYLRGVHSAFGTLRQDYRTGLDCFEQALALDPDFHPAGAMAPWAAAYGNLIAGPDDLPRYAAMARRAVRGAGEDARTLAMAATAVFYLEHDFDLAERAVEQALALNPNEYTAWVCAGWISVNSGDHAQAMARLARAERLNPLAYARDGIHAGRALSFFFAGRDEEAEHHVQLALGNQAANPAAISTGVAIAARRGDLAALAQRRATFLARYPEGIASLAIRALPFRHQHLREAFFSALRAGGIPG